MRASEVRVGDQFLYADNLFLRIQPLFPVEFNVVYTLYSEWIYAVNLETGGVVIIDANSEVTNA